MTPYDDRSCFLGEGPIWHPGQARLYWFDIINKRLNWRENDQPRAHQFDEFVSAAGIIDDTNLLIASETALFRFDLTSGTREDIAPLEADTPATRSNDGRADPQGGFWIGTMGKKAEPGAGSIWRYYRGEMRRIFSGITVTNAICFTPDGGHAYFVDSRVRKIQKVALDKDGWPAGAPELFLDLSDAPGSPDGAVTDAAGNLWNAQWGGSRVAVYAPDGAFLGAHDIPGKHATCPAFGGADMTTLFVTSAQENLPPEEVAATPAHGQTFALHDLGPGRAEPHVIL